MSKMVQVAELSICNSEDELIFENINFSVKRGQISQLTGLSDFQYEVLFGILIGEIKPDSGQIVISGRNVVRLNEKKRKEMLQEEVSFIPSNFQLPTGKTLRRSLEFKLGVLGKDFEVEEKIDETLRIFELGGFAGSTPTEMGEFEKTMGSLALATVNGPRLLVCHNPFTHLQESEMKEAVRLLSKSVDSSNITVFLLTNELKSEVDGVTRVKI